jgi:NTP pyrophosphatase (non-canonical NTP hydrolase)
MITEQQREVLVIAQEEAAEVIQEISKVFRFGIDSVHRDGMPHRQKLTSEVGDLLCMIDLMIDHRLIDPAAVEIARQAKVSKLRKYSQLYA